MVNTTETYWTVDGVSLQTLAFNITTLGGDREAPPSVRGEDIRIPYAPGSEFQPKVLDNRIISLSMWVIGADENGFIKQDESARRTFNRNWSKIQKLLFRYRKQFTLGKRFWVETAELVAAGAQSQALATEGAWSLIYAEAKASFAGGLSPLMNGPSRASFTVDLLLSDPYFYSSPITITGTVASPTKTTTILGDDRTHNITVAFGGPITKPKLTSNYTGSPYFQYDAALVSGATASADVKAFSVKKDTSGTITPVSGYAKHAGSNFWFFLDPGSVSLTLSAESGTGSSTLTYRPAWL